MHSSTLTARIFARQMIALMNRRDHLPVFDALFRFTHLLAPSMLPGKYNHQTNS